MFILSEVLELFFNYRFYQNKEYEELMQSLTGKSFQIELIELQYPIILYFNRYRIYVFDNWNNRLTCKIRTSLLDIYRLLININFKYHMNNVYFEIQGDLKETQNLIKFIDERLLNVLKFYINASVLKKIHYQIQHICNFLQNRINIIKLCLDSAVTDEWKIVPHYLAVLWFYKKICYLIIQERHLFKRLESLEKYYNVF